MREAIETESLRTLHRSMTQLENLANIVWDNFTIFFFKKVPPRFPEN